MIKDCIKKSLIFGIIYLNIIDYSEGSYHIDASVREKSMKLSELHHNVTRNSFLNRDTLYSHVVADVRIFSASKCFFPNHVNLYTIGTAIQC